MAIIEGPDPVGTPGEIMALGQSPAAWGSCAPSPHLSKNHGVLGCPHYAQCIFAFRDQGPHNVGVLVQLENGRGRERQLECYAFMGTLYDRYREQDETGEIVAVVAQEGETIDVEITQAEAPRSKDNMRMVTTFENRPIKPFPRPGEEGSKLGPAVLRGRQINKKLREKILREREERRLGIHPSDKGPPLAAVALPREAENVEPEAQEVRRGPGRPRKHPL